MNATGVERLLFCGRYEQWTTIKLKENLGHVVQIDIYRKRNSKSHYSENTKPRTLEVFLKCLLRYDQSLTDQQEIITVVERWICACFCPFKNLSGSV